MELARELQIDAAALLVAARDRRWFVPLAGQARPLRGDSALHALAAADSSPLSTDPGDPHSVFTLLPAEDQRWVLDTQTALLVPLAGSDGESAGLLALSAKRTEALFTEDERWELSGLCEAVALALENRGLHEALQPGSPRVEEQELPATECPRCRRVHPTEQERCACGTPLVVAPLPRVLLGKLELRERLGEGGMGLVYRAFDRELERSVAVKTLPRVSEEATQRLRQEARSMAAVSHPAVAVIYGVESWQGLPFLVVEHLAGGTLARRLGSPWPVEEALLLGVDLADALDAIHRRGLLHRDVKPSNIGFDGEGAPQAARFRSRAARPALERACGWLTDGRGAALGPPRGERIHAEPRSRGNASLPLARGGCGRGTRAPTGPLGPDPRPFRVDCRRPSLSGQRAPTDSRPCPPRAARRPAALGTGLPGAGRPSVRRRAAPGPQEAPGVGGRPAIGDQRAPDRPALRPGSLLAARLRLPRLSVGCACSVRRS